MIKCGVVYKGCWGIDLFSTESTVTLTLAEAYVLRHELDKAIKSAEGNISKEQADEL